MIPKLTLDGGLLREAVLLPAVRTLKAWDAEGRIEIFETDRAKEVSTPSDSSYGWPGAKRPHPRAKVARKVEAGGVSFAGISSVLFPQRDAHRLSLAEVNDVAHLLRHFTQGRTIFVTTNTETFIAGGRRERLAALKIIVLTPDEAILAIEKSAPAPTSAARKRTAEE